MARSMFAHAEILMGTNNHRGQTYTHRIFRWRKSTRFFDLRGGPSHTLSAASRPWTATACPLIVRERHEACSLQIRRRHLAEARTFAQGRTRRRREISGRRTEPDTHDELSPGSTGDFDRHQWA